MNQKAFACEIHTIRSFLPAIIHYFLGTSWQLCNFVNFQVMCVYGELTTLLCSNLYSHVTCSILYTCIECWSILSHRCGIQIHWLKKCSLILHTHTFDTVFVVVAVLIFLMVFSNSKVPYLTITINTAHVPCMHNVNKAEKKNKILQKKTFKVMMVAHRWLSLIRTKFKRFRV